MRCVIFPQQNKKTFFTARTNKTCEYIFHDFVFRTKQFSLTSWTWCEEWTSHSLQSNRKTKRVLCVYRFYFALKFYISEMALNAVVYIQLHCGEVRCIHLYSKNEKYTKGKCYCCLAPHYKAIYAFGCRARTTIPYIRSNEQEKSRQNAKIESDIYHKHLIAITIRVWRPLSNANDKGGFVAKWGGYFAFEVLHMNQRQIQICGG